MNVAEASSGDGAPPSSERGKFAALFFGVLILVWWFWNGPLVSFGFDPQLERCLPDLHLALMVHRAPSGIHDGDLLFWKPSGALAGFKESFILKEVAGVPGDHLVISAGRVSINGRTVVSGLPLAHFYRHSTKDFDRDEVIPPGNVFMVGVHPLSNDSRYWGYLNVNQISGFAYRIF